MRLRPVALILLLAAVAPSAAGTIPVYDDRRCDALVAAGDYENRFAVFRSIHQITACHLDGVITAPLFRAEAIPRIRDFVTSCFLAHEQERIGRRIRMGTLRYVGSSGPAACHAELLRFGRLGSVVD